MKRISLFVLLLFTSIASFAAAPPTPVVGPINVHFEPKTDGTTGNVLFAYNFGAFPVDFLAGTFTVQVAVDGGAFATVGTVPLAQPFTGEQDFSLNGITGLLDGKSYVWQVKLTSTNPASPGEYESAYVASPAYVVELLVGDPTISFLSATNNTIQVTIGNTVTGTNDYRIFFGLPGGTISTFDILGLPVAGNQNADVTGLTGNTTYQIGVQALKGGVPKNTLVWLVPNPKTNRDAPPMASYFSLIPPSPCPESAMVQFAFADPSQIDSWQITNNSGGAILASGGVPAAGNITATLGLAPGTAYDLRLLAMNETGVSYTNLAFSTPSYLPPDAATNLTNPYDITETTMTIAWTNGVEDNACQNKIRDEYEIIAVIIHRDGTLETKRYGAFKSATSLVVDGLSPKDRVVLSVVAINNTHGHRVPSTTVSGITLGPPWDPTDLAASTTVDPLGENQVDLSWTDNAEDEDGTDIEIQNADGSWRVLAKILANNSMFSHKPVEEGLTYVYRIRAFNQYGYSGYTAEVSHTLAYTKEPEKPFNLTATMGDGMINLAWQDDSNREKEFFVNRSMDGGATWVKIATIGRNMTTHSDGDVSPGNTYQYTVEASNDVGKSDPSNVAEIAYPATPDPDPEPAASASISVFPNPTVDMVNLKVPNASRGTVSLINQSNRRVMSRSVNFNNGEASLDISRFAPGAYYLIITTETSKFSKKIYKY